MNDQTIGTCSICGGPVTVPTVFWSIVPPSPTCAQCGAVASHGPVIPMRAAPRYRTSTGTSLIVEDDDT